MPIISRGGLAQVQVPAGQSIIIGSFGAGACRISYATTYTAGNIAPLYILNSTLSGGSTTLGAFANGQAIQIEAPIGGDVEYVIGSAPQLTTANPTQMPTIQMGAGQRILASAVNGLTAKAGGGQSGATLCSADISRFTTVATAADSGLLPAALPGMALNVSNAGANSMNLFPATGEQINALGANAAFAVAAGKSVELYCAVAGQWHAVLSA